MMNFDIRETIEAYLEDQITNSDRNIYFKQVYSSKDLSESIVESIVKDSLDHELTSSPQITGKNGIVARIEESPIIFWEFDESRWIIIYSSSLERRARNRLDDVANHISWLLDVWIPSDIVDNLYHEYSPEQDKVNIERKWDPYYIYQRTSDIPENLQEYYNDNINKFVEQEIEFNLKTPRWMVDQALNEGVREDLLEKSEISKSRFTFQSPDDAIRQDGGTQTRSSSRVTIRQGGQFVHRSGDIDATYDMIEKVNSENTLLDEFQDVLPSRHYEEKEAGIVDLISYDSGKVLQIIFKEKEYNEEANIKLSNLLTVGQSDVKLHGVVKKRGDLWFFAESHMAFDNGEYEILFVGEDNPPFDKKYPKHASIYIKPESATAPGLVYLYQKLSEKFDSRIVHQTVENLPLEEVK